MLPRSTLAGEKKKRENPSEGGTCEATFFPDSPTRAGQDQKREPEFILQLPPFAIFADSQVRLKHPEASKNFITESLAD